MKTRLTLDWLAALLLAILIQQPFTTFAQGSAFTYQGRLNELGGPANGDYDLRFTLFDASADGNVVAGPLAPILAVVTNGLFTLRLDFGAGAFNGSARWLNIEVRPAGDPNFTPLTPRHEVVSSPYAIRAASAGSVADGAVTANQLNTGLAPAPGQFLSYDGGNLVWSDPGHIFSRNGNSAYYTGGNVGIGTSSPETKLAVFSSGYGIEQTDGFRRLSTYISASGGWFGTRSEHSLNFFVNSGGSSLTIATNGGVGLGTDAPTPGVRLDVVGATLLRPGNGNIQFGSPNGELGMSLAPALSNSRADLRFDGSVLKLVAGPGTVPPSSLNGLAITTGGNVGIGTTAPVAKLHAETPQANTAAVYGKATGSGGVGVYGQSANGAAVYAEGNAVQPRDQGGFVKAMAYIDPFLPANQYVVRCYNSQQTGSATSTAPCGITVARSSTGSYTINFGFNVEDRFISLTAQATATFPPTIVTGMIVGVSGSQVFVNFHRTGDAVAAEDSRFHIIIY